MKKSCVFIFILFIFLSCTRNDNNTGPGSSISPRVKRQVMDIAIDYTLDKLKDGKKSVLKNGIVKTGNDQLNYIIDPARILTGLIDDDTNEDAIISIPSYKGQFQVMTEHLILIKTDGKFKITRVLSADMKFMEIKDGAIFVEIPKFASDSPFHDCSECKEVVQYKYKDGQLVRTE